MADQPMASPRAPDAGSTSPVPADAAGALLLGIFWSIGLNTVIPVILYQLSKRYVSPSEYTALLFATLFPVGEGLWGLARHRQMDPIAVMVLLGIVVDGTALSLGGSPRLLLVRESFVTGAFGVACFVSLLLRRPLMFYFGRFFMAGNDPVRRARFDASWALPEVRRGNRLVTIVWGVIFVGELLIRIALIYTLSPPMVLVISPLVLGVLTVAAMVWSLAFGRRMRQRILPWLERQGRAGTPQPD
ncbi:MAG TPA: VC0807 family protein [Terriglobales bacterium]|nr:VC0807 family protein [Terriglobales bacterium]